MQRAAAQDRFRRQRLQHRAGHDAAIRDAEAIAELERGAADDDLLVLQPAERCFIAVQDVDERNPRDRLAADAEIDHERRAAGVVLPREHRAHRGQEFAVELLAERIAPHQPIGFDGDIDDRGPGMVAELFQRPVEMGVPAGARLLERGQHHRSAGAAQRLDEGAVGGGVRGRAEIDVEYDVPDTGPLKLPQQFGMKPARPGPNADLLDRGSVDRDHDDVAAGVL